MVIAQITGMRSSKYGGIEKFFVHSAEIATKNGHRYICVYESKPYSQGFIDDFESRGGEIKIIPCRKTKIRFFIKMLFFLSREKVDIVHLHFQPALYIALLASMLMRLKNRYLTIHSTFENKNTGEEVFAIKEVCFKSRILAKFKYMFVKKVFCVSERIKSQHFELFNYNEKCKTRYLGTDLKEIGLDKKEAREKLNLNYSDFIITNISMHVPRKRIDDALVIIKKLKDRNLDIKFLQIGYDPQPMDYENHLMTTASMLGLEKQVLWVGRTDNVSLYLKASDLLLHVPSGEGLGLVIAEAFSQGCPVVATNIGGIPELVSSGENGYLINVGDTDQAALHIIELIENRRKLKKFGVNGNLYIIKNFDVVAQSHKYLAEYETH